MSVGFGLLSAQLPPGRSPTGGWEEAYRRTIALAVRAEEKGFDSVWTTEHHFVDDGYMPSLLVTSAAIAARTSRIEIGTGLVLGPLHHPLRLAEDAATVQLLSDGRLVLGLGLGWLEYEFAALGVDLHRRGRAMEEIYRILPLAWRGEPFHWRGEVYAFPELAVRPVPHRRIPIVGGGRAEAGIRRAARLADGFLAISPPDRFVQEVAWALDEMERIGRDPATFRWRLLSTVFPGDPEEALPHVWYQRWKYADMTASATRTTPLPEAPPLSAELAEKARGWVVAGPSAAIVEHFRRVRAAVPVPVDFVVRSFFATLPWSRQVELLDRIAEEIVPHL